MKCSKCFKNKFYIEEIKSCRKCLHNGVYIDDLNDYIHCEFELDVQRTQADETGYCEIGYSGNRGCHKVTCVNCLTIFNIPNNFDK